MPALLILFALVVLPGARQQATAASLEAEINKSGSALVYGIRFTAESASLEIGAEKLLQEIVVLMKGHSDWRFEVQGHTSGIGTRAMNLAASDQRAKAVVAWLVEHGIEAERLQSKGCGDTRPVVVNATVEARALNERIQLRKLNEE